MRTDQSHRPGFSLLELLLVVTLIGIIASIVVVRISSNAEFAKIQSCFHNRSEINSAVERWYLEQNAWPANDLSDIGVDANYFPGGIPTCPVTGAAYSLDPTILHVSGHTSNTTPGDH